MRAGICAVESGSPLHENENLRVTVTAAVPAHSGGRGLSLAESSHSPVDCSVGQRQQTRGLGLISVRSEVQLLAGPFL